MAIVTAVQWILRATCNSFFMLWLYVTIICSGVELKHMWHRGVGETRDVIECAFLVSMLFFAVVATVLILGGHFIWEWSA